MNANELSGLQKNIEVGMPINIIVNQAKRNDVDLIIMGSKGENRSKIDQLLGSIAAGVVKNAHCPVVVVPEKTPFTGINRIAYATNLLEADPFELWKSIKILSPFNPIIHCVYIDLDKKGDIKAWKRIEEMEAFFSENHPGIQLEFHQFSATNLVDGLNDFIARFQIDLLVMYQPSRKFWDRLFHRSATKKMAVQTHVPLLVQKET